MKIRILFVDDEPKLLEGLKRSLRALRDEWDMRFAASGREALEILGSSPFDVIVTDMRMPGMDGVTLLREVSGKHPELLRIVLSGQSDMESIVKASGVTHQYLSKPCSFDSLKEVVVHSFCVSEKLKSSGVKSLISSIDALPSLEQSYLELTKALDSPDASVEEIGQIIRRDVAMSSKVLQLMNSAFFGRIRRITDPGEAVGYLGTDTIKALAIAVHAFRGFETGTRTNLNVPELWAHSIACSGLAERIAKHLFPGDKEIRSLARTAGLLHDVGRLVIACKLPRQFKEAEESAKRSAAGLWSAEIEVLGVSHAEIGAYLLAFWGLPSRIVEAVAFHHAPSECASREFSALAVVHIANGLLRASGPSACPIDVAYLDRIGYKHQFESQLETWSDWVDAAA